MQWIFKFLIVRLEAIMTSIDNLNAAVSGLQGTEANLVTAVTLAAQQLKALSDKVAALTAEVAAASDMTAVDNAVTALNTVKSGIDAATATLTSATPPSV
jgi:hypothetical protein